jgi:hypothetical protein
MNILERFVNPSKHVLEPYGTVCKNGDQYFIQVCKEEGVANWITLGEMLEIIHQDSVLREDFIKDSLELYEKKIVQRGANL